MRLGGLHDLDKCLVETAAPQPMSTPSAVSRIRAPARRGSCDRPNVSNSHSPPVVISAPITHHITCGENHIFPPTVLGVGLRQRDEQGDAPALRSPRNGHRPSPHHPPRGSPKRSASLRGKPVELPPIPAQERRPVHAHPGRAQLCRRESQPPPASSARVGNPGRGFRYCRAHADAASACVAVRFSATIMTVATGDQVFEHVRGEIRVECDVAHGI